MDLIEAVNKYSVYFDQDMTMYLSREVLDELKGLFGLDEDPPHCREIGLCDIP